MSARQFDRLPNLSSIPAPVDPRRSSAAARAHVAAETGVAAVLTRSYMHIATNDDTTTAAELAEQLLQASTTVRDMAAALLATRNALQVIALVSSPAERGPLDFAVIEKLAQVSVEIPMAALASYQGSPA